jgi:hypothetical protein
MQWLHAVNPALRFGSTRPGGSFHASVLSLSLRYAAYATDCDIAPLIGGRECCRKGQIACRKMSQSVASLKSP